MMDLTKVIEAKGPDIMRAAKYYADGGGEGSQQ